MITWIYGNTLPIAARLRKTTKTEQGSVTEDYIPPEGSIIRPAIVGKYTKKVYDECSIDGNVVTFTDDGTLSVGTYGIEIRVIEPSKNMRSFKCGELTILNCSQALDLNLGEFLDNGAVVIESMPYFFAKGDKGDKGDQGEQGISGGMLFPTMDFNPDTGILTVRGLPSEVQRISYDYDSGDLIIKI